MAPLNQMVMQPSPLGELFVSMADVVGPSYLTGGVAISANAFALQTFKQVFGGVTQSGTYWVAARSISGPGAATIKLVWFVVATGAEVANATSLVAETVRLMALGN